MMEFTSEKIIEVIGEIEGIDLDGDVFDNSRGWDGKLVIEKCSPSLSFSMTIPHTYPLGNTHFHSPQVKGCAHLFSNNTVCRIVPDIFDPIEKLKKS